MNKKSICTKLRKIPPHFLAVFAVHICLVGLEAPVASGKLVTFRFEAKLTEPQGVLFPVPLGQVVTGSYSFELNTPATVFGPNSFTLYDNAVKYFEVNLIGFGTGTSNAGSIWIGDPVQTSGSFNFLSDQYVVSGDVTGITVPTSYGDRHLVSAQIRLQDLDQNALSSDKLSATPPGLMPFLDSTGPNYDSDHANIYLTFDSPFGGVNSPPFQLTSLAAIPEPCTLLLFAIGTLAAFINARTFVAK